MRDEQESSSTENIEPDIVFEPVVTRDDQW
jgi:hypothetical protein